MSPLKYENIPRKQSLFNIKKEFFYNVIVPWHVHVEYELVFLNMAAGSKHIGSTFGRIEGKEVLLIGPYLPHNWQNTRVTSSGGGIEDNDYQICIHFDENAFGQGFFDLAPFYSIKELLMQAEYGLSFEGDAVVQVGSMMEEMLLMDDFEKSMALLRLLRFLADGHAYRRMSTFGFRNTDNEEKVIRMNKVFKYININYKEHITLRDLAEVASMVPQSFCSYFKERTGKSPMEFINEVRISHACKMLHVEEYSIERICYDTGFSSLSNFNRQFKHTTGLSPSAFRASIRMKA